MPLLTRHDLQWNIGDQITDDFVTKVEIAILELSARTAETFNAPGGVKNEIAGAIRKLKDLAK